MTDVSVRPFFRVVANGLAGNGKHRMSLVATPERALQGGFPLSKWPSEMAKLVARGIALSGDGGKPGPFQVKIAIAPKATQVLTSTGCWTAAEPDIATIREVAATAAIKRLGDPKSSTVWTDIDAIWQEAFVGVADDKAWTDLQTLIDRSLTGKTFTADLSDKADPAAIEDRGRMRPSQATPTNTTVIKTIIPARQSDLAFHLEAERARRVAEQIRAPLPQLSDLALNAPKAVEPPAGPVTAEVLLAELKKRKQDELMAVVDATEEDRKWATGKFKEVTDRALSRLCKPVSKDTPKVQDPGQPAPATRAQAAKTQLYGSWAQAPQAPDHGSDAKRQEHVAHTFYALQGDPGFARLFCLTIDLEVEKLDAGYVFLAAESDAPERATPLVWTAAKIANDHFWPAPKDEIDVPQVALVDESWDPFIWPQIAGLDQFDGIAMMGAGASATAAQNNPRFGLVSLDMRRAAELTGSDSVDDAGGNANGFKTAGFTILDRMRADEAVRTAARTSAQNSVTPMDGEHRVRALLFAEDLTIGRRLDVAVGNKSDDRWRSLMNRTVSYDFRVAGKAKPGVRTALDMLIGAPGTPERRDLDASSMTFVSRLVPRGPAPAQDASVDVDAVVEEAVAQWDGTPMAVLCAPERPEPTGRRLPFRRTLSLPDAKTDPASRPPPLRYGVGYRFAMRSTFLGGHSVPMREDGGHLQRQFNTTKIHPMAPLLAFPAKFGDEQSPAARRRFLRHEAVGHPDILLPQHIATKNNGAIGFEQAERAVLRFNNSDAVSSDEFIAGAPYRPADQRAYPRQTMRIVVPPTIAQDDAVRHGMFDVTDFAARLKGGLLDVRRDRQILKDDVLVPAGFPVAVTRKPTGFGSTGAEKVRDIVYLGEDGPAETVFVPGHDVGRRQPFLPDPAAETYVLRLKHRATGAYLDGSLPISVYDGGLAKWPNARPLAIVMTQVKNRPAPSSLDDVLTLAKAPDQFLSSDGTLAKSGARVRVVEMRVAPSEDFMLEIFCVPSPERLAKWFSLPETLGALMNPMGTPIDAKALEAMFGRSAADALKACLATHEKATDCHCSLGGHVGANDDLLLEVSRILLQHMACIQPIAELSAVASIRAACVASRPAQAPQWAVSPLPKDLDAAIAAVEWIGDDAEVRRSARNLFGAPGATRPAPVEDRQEGSGIRTRDALDVAKMVFDPRADEGSKEFLLTGAISLDLTDADSFEIVAETVSPRSSVMDDTSRRRSLKARRAGRWPSLLDATGQRRFLSVQDVYGFAGIDDEKRVSLRRSQVTLLRCEALPVDGAIPRWPRLQGRSVISLAMVHEAARRGVIVVDGPSTPPPAGGGQPSLMFKSDQVHTFPDAKARKLLVKAVAFSRFAADWETADRWRGPKEANVQQLARRQPLNRAQQIRESDQLEVWLPASERPAKCVVRSPMPVFRTERLTVDDHGLPVHTLKRGSVTRVYLSRGWFSSGEEERLGVVVWPPNQFDDPRASLARKLRDYYGRDVQLDQLSDEFLGNLGGFITRWGGDPIRWDSEPDTEPLIGPLNFADVAHLVRRPGSPPLAPEVIERLSASPHDPRIETDVLMPVAVPADENDASGQQGAKPKFEMAQVSLITYQPCFDADREEWFVDIEITPSKSTDPFIRLGLVRYQPHAPDILKVSEPVVVWSQILPSRSVTLTPMAEKRGGLSVCATVSGQASERVRHHTRYEKTGHPIYDVLDKPHMRMAVVHEASDGKGRLRRTPVNLAAYQAVDTDPHIEHGIAQWTLNLSIAAGRLAELGPGQFYAYFEEVERRMPATYAAEPIKPETMFTASTLTESGPRFSARVPFEAPSTSPHATQNELGEVK
ncbi:hypothetical protein Mesau_00571 [Mesorhizobium australicum WSM2073]|uniref:Uncharacterized protein n=1 Tax=Mesorhizobium australicum (strain HAMBI 3006 / LMG 24608 / WSM2073) TaxID=754035 RepID=L0KDH4_MESAW|nr:hypothetical protein [Mesorhizobium australicum]AGB43061.1 hypothetical protein Mesau_00571 [Mesorhizobium australicum WSM2073]